NPNLLILLINDIFDEAYDNHSEVVLLSDEHQTETGDEPEEDGEVITDSYISIEGDTFHLECQSNPDNTIVFRMIEYDFHIALDDALRSGKSKLIFPRSAVLYLRHNKNTRGVMHLELVFPNNRCVDYDVPIIKVMNISKEDIIQKKLYFLAPYYIMKKEIGMPPEKALTDFVEILMAMQIDRRQGYVTGYDIVKVQKYFQKLVVTVYPELKDEEGVDYVMGGRVIYDEIDQAFDDGIEQGIEQGLEQGAESTLIKSIKNLMNNLKMSAVEAMNSLGIPEEEQAKYLEKI
nr:hypothetical protein [Eubacterium sp.]